jgi:hypothetical protein
MTFHDKSPRRIRAAALLFTPEPKQAFWFKSDRFVIYWHRSWRASAPATARQTPSAWRSDALPEHIPCPARKL